ncbi:hypothetical protein [Streptomyces sp. 11-1-2]|uniref:hypothetical protein n=1 Tax=unclassified Streptomyces TaxID=2593676 RepID=UPI000B8D3BF9|nr:hypothetical protein [Streptomyces sp. 11-1-2]ASQ99665.1 hypothetical protein CGL27_47595 [Streptomyces sp. 11-1-2]
MPGAILAPAVSPARAHSVLLTGRLHATEGLGDYCGTALPPVLRRLPAVESGRFDETFRVGGEADSHP